MWLDLQTPKSVNISLLIRQILPQLVDLARNQIHPESISSRNLESWADRVSVKQKISSQRFDGGRKEIDCKRVRMKILTRRLTRQMENVARSVRLFSIR